MKKTILVTATTIAMLHAGGNIHPKEVHPAASEVETLAKKHEAMTDKPLFYLSDFYAGVGIGRFELSDKQTDEAFQSNYVMLKAGIDFNSVLGLEGRYTYGYEDIHYDRGSNQSQQSQDLDAKYSNIALYLKARYAIKDFEPYILVGYGESKTTNIRGFDRYEDGLQYGGGIGYHINSHWEVSVDYVRAYDKKGFDGIGQLDDLKVDLLTFGVTYHF